MAEITTNGNFEVSTKLTDPTEITIAKSKLDKFFKQLSPDEVMGLVKNLDNIFSNVLAKNKLKSYAKEHADSKKKK